MRGVNMSIKIEKLLTETIRIIWNGFLIAVGVFIAKKFMGA